MYIVYDNSSFAALEEMERLCAYLPEVPPIVKAVRAQDVKKVRCLVKTSSAEACQQALDEISY